MQVTRITSEALQATIRRLLPSQQGFGEDLEASNVIIPVIDLTPTAEGSALPTDLARALAFGSQTAFNVNNTTTTVVNTAGFYRLVGTSGLSVANAAGGTIVTNSISMSDGLATKVVWQHSREKTTGDTSGASVAFDLVFFLDSGDSISITAHSDGVVGGSSRQIADLNGNIVNPSGFVSQ